MLESELKEMAMMQVKKKVLKTFIGITLLISTFAVLPSMENVENVQNVQMETSIQK